MAHISKIPREVLALIFLALRDQYAVARHDYDNAWFRGIYRWYRDTKLVCRLWRDVAREYCYLWDIVELSLPQRHTILAKVKAAPLSAIYNTDNGGDVPDLFQGYHEYVPRIKSLTIVGANHWRSAFKDVKTLPKLQELTLYRTTGERKDELERLPDIFKLGDFPVLSTIDIRGYQFDIHSSIFSQNIRSLRLAFPMNVVVPRNLTRQNVTDLLRNMPLLEYLGLHGPLRGPYNRDFVDPAQDIDCARVTLPHLRCLSVFSCVQSCILLLASLIFPNNTNVDIHSICVDLHQWPYVARLFKVLRSKLDGSDTLGTYEPVRSLIVQNSPLMLKPNVNRSLIFMHCLKTEYPCGDGVTETFENQAYFAHALEYPLHACTDFARKLWNPDKMLGVRLVLMSPPGCMVFPDKSFSTFCRDWPLGHVRNCAVGTGYITIPEIRHTCPRIRVLYLDTERYATWYGYSRGPVDIYPAAELFTDGPHTEIRLIGEDTEPLHPPEHLKELYTIALLWPYGFERFDEAVSVVRYHIQQLIKAKILTTVVGEMAFISLTDIDDHLELVELWQAYAEPQFNITNFYKYEVGRDLYR